MNDQSFTTTLTVHQSPKDVFNAINNVSGWSSEEITGKTEKLNDEFTYHYGDVHRCKIKIIESIPGKKVVWLVVNNYFSFTKDTSEWTGTTIVFEISEKDNTTQVRFTHQGLVPQYECYNACVNGWSQYIQHSLLSLITTAKGHPNSSNRPRTIDEVAARFNELANQEKWFDIQDELFADNVKSVEPSNSPWLKNAEGKFYVRKKGENWVQRIEAVHRTHTTEPIVGGNHFAVGREMDITVQGLGRLKIDEIMVYEVQDGRIVTEQFIY